jgi:pimeloyl-ACP methyl ester carboxylesterase
MPVDAASGVHYELIGAGPPLLVGLPLMASHVEIFGAAAQPMFDGWVSRLADAYTLCLVDYPAIGRSADLAPEALVPERVTGDLLSVASAAGFARFAFFGYSWSGAVGLRLLERTDRLTALAIGGWPPLDAPVAPLLAAARRRVGNVPASAKVVLRSDDQYRQWVAWNTEMLGWDSRPALAGSNIPKLVVFGANGDLDEDGESVPIASRIRDTRPALEALGWEVVEVPGYGHELAVHPEAIVPPLRRFLDARVPR